ncbi:hypothetical protein BO70DRAFT_94966 [Aspergillus heteromorphus CBS 117.55]|uniref:Uncharacterized protein n=1 Tax=Aspergillus heteromorphus CBS 117.55 TaxID=1448321 RepID=A0A317VTZ9_9EURO|nr:uncharacterized protein BO70DRAFT_94966 [Aspergillus heteromorphus CBS 117.55]PWY76338.1 hypothetical protein BO70DRAFT_94966 [Aspergillus heteromorphus CBS 117.55]
MEDVRSTLFKAHSSRIHPHTIYLEIHYVLSISPVQICTTASPATFQQKSSQVYNSTSLSREIPARLTTLILPPGGCPHGPWANHGWGHSCSHECDLIRGPGDGVQRRCCSIGGSLFVLVSLFGASRGGRKADWWVGRGGWIGPITDYVRGCHVLILCVP